MCEIARFAVAPHSSCVLSMWVSSRRVRLPRRGSRHLSLHPHIPMSPARLASSKRTARDHLGPAAIIGFDLNRNRCQSPVKVSIRLEGLDCQGSQVRWDVAPAGACGVRNGRGSKWQGRTCHDVPSGQDDNIGCNRFAIHMPFTATRIISYTTATDVRVLHAAYRLGITFDCNLRERGISEIFSPLVDHGPVSRSGCLGKTMRRNRRSWSLLK